MIAPEERTERFGLPLVCVATDKICYLMDVFALIRLKAESVTRCFLSDTPGSQDTPRRGGAQSKTGDADPSDGNRRPVVEKPNGTQAATIPPACRSGCAASRLCSRNCLVYRL